jgi:hypothetical protein
MSKLHELAALLDGLEEEGANWRDLRAAKKLVHELMATEAGK